MRKLGHRSVRAPRRVADSGIDQAIVDWNNHNAYRSGSLRTLIDAGLVSWGHGGWAPTKTGRQRGLNPNHLESREHRVADFNTLEDTIEHAARELGATHVSGDGPTTKIYFPRGGEYPYEAASVRRKGGYWHADGPGAREGVKSLPRGARPIRRPARRAAEARRGKSPQQAGKEYAESQIANDQFEHWVMAQIDEAEQMRRNDPDSVLPLENEADARKIAHNMLQQLEWDMKREAAPLEQYGIEYSQEAERAFWNGFHEAAHKTAPWLADKLLTMSREARHPKAKRSTRRNPSA